MAADDLSAPLGQDSKVTPARLPVAPATVIAILLGLPVTIFLGWAIFKDDPLGGEPTAVVAVDKNASAPANASATPASPQATPTKPGIAAGADAAAAKGDGKAAPGMQTVTIIDGSSGKRQEIAIAPTSEGPREGTGDSRLLELTRHGLIPKVASDGSRAFEVYARPVAKSGKPDAPRIAIVVTGLGIGAAATSDAITKLPGAVTLAFAPYGADIERSVTRARKQGHEVLLQVPMEPFDYPDNDPGPQTLLTSLPADQNIDRLYWTMSRVQGYVGVANYMGARFTAAEGAMTPVLKEVAKRGLLYVDDGAATRSLAGQIAGANSLPFAKPDVVLDALPTPADISKAIAKLETIARDKGQAVGVISALPAVIDRIAQWAKTAEGRGFLLVPISAAAGKEKQS